MLIVDILRFDTLRFDTLRVDTLALYYNNVACYVIKNE